MLKIVRCLGPLAGVAVLVGTSACASSAVQEQGPQNLLGARFATTPTSGELATIGTYGRVLLIAPRDSAVVLSTSADVSQISALPDVVIVCALPGSDSTSLVEATATYDAAQADSVSAIFRSFGRISVQHETLIDGGLPVFRVRLLQDYLGADAVDVNVCPAMLGGRSAP